MKKYIILQLVMIFSLNGIGQSLEDLPVENITVITDREEYIPGENIWFSIFTNNAKQKYLSKTAYVELISPYCFSVNRQKLSVEDGTANGNFIIPDTLSTGYYTLLVYTNYAKNKGFNTFEKKKLLIYNPEKISQISKSNKENTFDYSIENNELISGLKCKIYYTADDITDLKIISNAMDTIVPKHDNKLRFFEFIPELNNKYTLLVNFTNNTRRITLPDVKQYGFVFNLNRVIEDSIEIRIQSNDMDRELTPYIFLDVNSQQLNKKIILNSKEVYALIEKDFLNERNNIIEIKNAYGKVLWDRAIEIKSKPYTSIEVGNLKDHYNKRSQVQLSIILPEEVTSTNANLSVSVRKSYDNKNVNLQSKSNYRTELSNSLFNREIKDTTANAIWENYGPIVFGKLVDKNNKPVSGTEVYLSYIDSISGIQSDITDEFGNFRFVVYSNMSLKDLIIKAHTTEDITIIVEDNYLNNYTDCNYQFETIQDSTYLSYLEKVYLNSRINKVYRLKQHQNDTTVISNETNITRKYDFYGTPDKSIDFDYYVLLDSIQEYFREFLPSISINNEGGKRVFRMVNESKQVLKSQPAIFIDGVFYKNPEILFSINPAICKRMDVVLSDFIIYNSIYGGLICLYTKNTNLENISIPVNSTRIEYKLYDETELFGEIPQISNIPDFRNTLYWEGDAKIRANETYNINFITGDDKSKYELIIYGFTNDGRIINEVKTFDVY